MWRPATYWPPGSWEEPSNVPVQVQACWTAEGDQCKVHLQSDVAEGGYLINGITKVSNPRLLTNAMLIEKFYTYPDLRALKQVRIAVVV